MARPKATGQCAKTLYPNYLNGGSRRCLGKTWFGETYCWMHGGTRRRRKRVVEDENDDDPIIEREPAPLAADHLARAAWRQPG